jgi:hypothetical protein
MAAVLDSLILAAPESLKPKTIPGFTFASPKGLWLGEARAPRNTRSGPGDPSRAPGTTPRAASRSARVELG